MLLELRLGARQHLAHGLDGGGELADARLGGRVHHRLFRPQQQHDNGDDAGRDGERQEKEKGLRHAAASSPIRSVQRTKGER